MNSYRARHEPGEILYRIICGLTWKDYVPDCSCWFGVSLGCRMRVLLARHNKAIGVDIVARTRR